MRTVISEISLGKYKALILDGPVPIHSYTKYRIDGIYYDIVPVYDAKNCIAVESSGSFLGKKVEFI